MSIQSTIIRLNTGLHPAMYSSKDYIYCAVAGKLVSQGYRSPNLLKTRKQKYVVFNKLAKCYKKANFLCRHLLNYHSGDIYDGKFTFHVSVFWVICLNLPPGIGAAFSL